MKGGVIQAMKLEEKKQIVQDLHEKFLKFQVVILTDYKGLDVTKLNTLRRQLREVDSEYRVVKNSLLVRACENTEVELIKDSFTGPSAIAYSYNDPVAPAKVLAAFIKEHTELEIKNGVLNGKVLDLNAIKALSDLPSREVLLGMLLSAANGVPTAFVRALNDVPIKMLNVLQAIKDQKEANA
ncbi:large subunit ribosomal protein L10 [Desulfosarcina sp. BuS5]|nr:large subunit ribosomal protein L10 [Desulfosarcina sp. BuS5]